MFSIIIPLYNKANYIRKTIRSILEQTYQDFEIIVVNDGSTDNSLNVVQEIKDKRIKIFTKKNGGVSAARNYGIKKAQYKYVAFLDADDLWLPFYLEEMCSLIKEYPLAGMYASSFKFQKGSEGNLEEHALALSNPENQTSIFVKDYCKSILSKKIFCWTSAVVVKREVFNDVGLFRENIQIGEDIDLWLRIGLNFQVAFSYKVSAIYVEESENNLMKSTIKLSKMFPFWEWYDYAKSRDLCAMTNGVMMYNSKLLCKEFNYKDAKFLFSKIKVMSLDVKSFLTYMLLYIKLSRGIKAND